MCFYIRLMHNLQGNLNVTGECPLGACLSLILFLNYDRIVLLGDRQSGGNSPRRGVGVFCEQRKGCGYKIRSCHLYSIPIAGEELGIPFLGSALAWWGGGNLNPYRGKNSKMGYI